MATLKTVSWREKKPMGAGVDAARTLLKLRNQLHGADLWRASDGAAGKQRAEDVLKSGFGAEIAGNGGPSFARGWG